MGAENNEIVNYAKKLENKEITKKNLEELIADNKITKEELKKFKEEHNLSDEEIKPLLESISNIIFLEKLIKTINTKEKKSENKKAINNSNEDLNDLNDLNEDLKEDFNIKININENTTPEEFDNIVKNIILKNSSKLNLEQIINLINKLKNYLDYSDDIGKKYFTKNKKGEKITIFNEKFFNIYLKNISPEKAEKIIQENGEKLKEENMCPKNSTILKIREKILEKKKAQFNKNAENYYGKEIGGKLLSFIDEKMNNSKEKLCGLKVIVFIQEFEKQKEVSDYLKENNLKGLSNNEKEIKKLISGMLEVKKSENKVNEVKKAEESNINLFLYKNSTKKEKINLLKENGFTDDKIEKITKELDQVNNKINKINDSEKFIKSLSNEEFTKILKNPNLNNPDTDFRKIRKEIETERVDKLIRNEYPESQTIVDNISSVSTEITDNNSITVDGVVIDGITQEEFREFGIEQEDGVIINIENSEALNNLIDMKKKFTYLHLDFAWENRTELFTIMQNTLEFGMKGFNLKDGDLIDKYELNIFLKFILKVAGEEPSDLDTYNYAEIRRINEVGEINHTTDFHSGLSNIGKRFIDAGYFNSQGAKTLTAKDDLLSYCRNGFKNKDKEEKSQEK